MNNQYIYSYNNQYNISIHTKNIEILTNGIKLLQDSNIHVDSFASVVNGIADFVQKNNYYTIFNSFFNIADYLVDIIERFQANDEYVRENKEALVIAMSKLKNEIIKKSHINLFFCGYDNNNILDKMNNIKNIFNVKTIDEAINRVKCSNKSSLDINILMIDKKIYMINKEYYKKYFSDLIYYDNLVDYLMDIGEQLYFSNYDYNYLINSMEKANIEPIDTIIVGNSYPLTGIDVRLLDYKCVSLALSSQDLYYSYKLAKSVIESNKHIKRCIIGSGYYLINHDLSKSKNLDAINRVRNVYYPIFKDAHNSQYIQKTEIRQIKNVSDDYIINYIII